MTAGTPCQVCTALAQAGRHEPFLVDDLQKWLRMWRCSRCGTLWVEGNVIASPIGEDEADAEAPGWRQEERRLTGTSAPTLLREYADGLLDDRSFAIALLHHDVLGVDTDPEGRSDLVLYSDAEAALADQRDVSELTWGSVARRLRWASGRRRVVIDPASPWRCDPDEYVVEYLDANGRRTETESDRRRGDA